MTYKIIYCPSVFAPFVTEYDELFRYSFMLQDYVFSDWQAIQEWCVETFTYDNYQNTWTYTQGFFCFRNENDALLFKLRWL